MLARIGEVVARVRARRGFAATELAARAEAEVGIIERLEAGQSGVTTTQLDAIARVLGLDPGALRRGEELGRPAPSVFLHHHGMQDFRDEDLAILDEAIEHARDLNALGRTLHELDATWPGATFRRAAAPHDSSDAAARHGYQLADELRRRLQRATEPLPDLRALAEEELSIVVLRRRLSTRGACAVKAGDAAAIVLNGSAPQFDARTRAAIAHEILFWDSITTRRTFSAGQQTGSMKIAWSARRFTSLPRIRRRLYSGKWRRRGAYYTAIGLCTIRRTRSSVPAT
jgi:transcriptional regulator with XRE-family HTH domain